MNFRALLKLSASIALFALVLWFIGPQRVLASFANADPRWLFAGFVASVAANLCSAMRWRALAAWLGMPASGHEMLFAYWRGITANAILPGATLGGDALRALHLQRKGYGLAPAVSSVFLDRLSGLWVLVVLSLAMTALALDIGMLDSARWPLSSTLTAGIAVVALAAPIITWQVSATVPWLPRKVRDMLNAMHARQHPLRLYAVQMLWSAGVQMLSIAAFTFAGHAIGLDLPWWQFVIAAGPIFILAAMPLSIGGWGTREAAAAIVLGGFGAPHEGAVACAILYGLFATLQALLGALTLMQTKGKPDASQ